jgi:hypothetical protein
MNRHGGFWLANRAWTIVAVTLCMSGPCRGEVTGADTVEWLTCSSEVIATGEITSSLTTLVGGDLFEEDCSLKVNQMIKGPQMQEIRFCYEHYRTDNTSSISLHQQLMVMLCRGKHHDIRKQNLLVPTSSRQPLSLVSLQNPPRDLFNREGRRITRRDEILAIARTWAKSPILNYLERDAAYDSDAFQQLQSGSAVWLKIPAEEKYRPEFIKLAQSENVSERTKAAGELGKYPSRETEEVLRRLLDDKTESESLFAADVIWDVRYPVREAAYHSLKQLGISVPVVPFQRPATPEEKRQLRISYWSNSFRRALPPDWKIV